MPNTAVERSIHFEIEPTLKSFPSNFVGTHDIDVQILGGIILARERELHSQTVENFYSCVNGVDKHKFTSDDIVFASSHGAELDFLEAKHWLGDSVAILAGAQITCQA